MGRRRVDIVVLSDVHLGTFGCRAKELSSYLKTISPEILILNGDFIDGWQFSKYYWPRSHMKVVRQIVRFLAKGVQVYYLTGNHDEFLRKFSPFKMGNFQLSDKLVLDVDGKRAWIFHGDVFDVMMKHSKGLVRLGSIGYGALILINKLVDLFSRLFGRGRLSLSKRIKNGVKKAVKYVDDFEATAVELARKKGYDYVICGHIHHPVILEVRGKEKGLVYMNAGDWVENMTSLEYLDGAWTIHRFLDAVSTPVGNPVHKTPKLPDLPGEMPRAAKGMAR